MVKGATIRPHSWVEADLPAAWLVLEVVSVMTSRPYVSLVFRGCRDVSIPQTRESLIKRDRDVRDVGRGPIRYTGYHLRRDDARFHCACRKSAGYCIYLKWCDVCRAGRE